MTEGRTGSVSWGRRSSTRAWEVPFAGDRVLSMAASYLSSSTDQPAM
ncbi:hypothetical protein ACSJJT_10335 [Cutibacterium sp. V947]